MDENTNQKEEHVDQDLLNTIADGAESEFSVEAEDLKRFLEDYEVKRIRKEFTSRVTTLIIASLGLVTALAWDDVLRQIFSELFESKATTLQRLYYAIAITLIATVISIVLGRLFLRKKKEK